MIYEIRFRNHGGHTFSTTVLTAEDDHHAIRLARQLFRGSVGHSYEIWCNDRLIFGDLLDVRSRAQAAGSARFHCELMRQCIEMALVSSDLQQRRLLMFFAEKVLGHTAKPQGPGQKLYKAAFGDPDGHPITELEFPAVSSKQAFAIASVLADACSESCERFELWQGETLQGSASGVFSLPSADLLHEHSRQVLIEREIMLHETCKTIDESDRLLSKLGIWFVDALFSVCVMGHA